MPQASLEVGTGLESFEDLSALAQTPIVAGSQGGGRYFGYHVWISVRAMGLDPRRVHAEFDLSGEDPAEILGHLELDRNLTEHEGWLTFAGARLLLEDCCRAEGRPVVLSSTVTDVRGARASDRRRTTLGECPRSPVDPTVDPCA